MFGSFPLGDDAGRVYGALIAGAGNIPPVHSRRTQTGNSSRKDPHSVDFGRKRTRRRRRSRKKAAASLPDPTGEASTDVQTSDAALALIRPVKREPALAQSSGSLSLLAAYSGGSSSSDDDSSSGPSQRSKGQLPIPSVIQDMFKERIIPPEAERKAEIASREASFWNTASCDSSLGYFEANNESLSSNTDDEETRSAPSAQTDQSNLVRSHDHRERINQMAQGVLTSYTCWKCSNVGHLAKDCTVTVPRGQGAGGGERVKIPKALQSLYAACREIKARKGQRCADCGVHSNLACCLDCRQVYK